MASLNKVMIIGNLGKDPEVRTIPNGTKVVNFSMATTERFTDKSGQKVDKTEWHRIVMWRGLADIAEKYLRKGSNVYIEGKLETRSWDDKHGEKRYTTEIVATNMQMLGGKQESQSNSSGYNPSANPTYSSDNAGMPPAPEDDPPF